MSEVTKRYCDLCKKEIAKYDPNLTDDYQNGNKYAPIHIYLARDHGIKHLDADCIKSIHYEIKEFIDGLRQ